MAHVRVTALLTRDLGGAEAAGPVTVVGNPALGGPVALRPSAVGGADGPGRTGTAAVLRGGRLLLRRTQRGVAVSRGSRARPTGRSTGKRGPPLAAVPAGASRGARLRAVPAGAADSVRVGYLAGGALGGRCCPPWAGRWGTPYAWVCCGSAAEPYPGACCGSAAGSYPWPYGEGAAPYCPG